MAYGETLVGRARVAARFGQNEAPTTCFVHSWDRGRNGGDETGVVARVDRIRHQHHSVCASVRVCFGLLAATCVLAEVARGVCRSARRWIVPLVNCGTVVYIVRVATSTKRGRGCSHSRTTTLCTTYTRPSPLLASWPLVHTAKETKNAPTTTLPPLPQAKHVTARATKVTNRPGTTPGRVSPGPDPLFSCTKLLIPYNLLQPSAHASFPPSRASLSRIHLSRCIRQKSV